MRTLLLGRKNESNGCQNHSGDRYSVYGINGTGGYGSGCRGRKGSKKDEIVWLCAAGNNGADGTAPECPFKRLSWRIYMDENRGTVELKAQFPLPGKLGISVKPWQEIETEKKGNTVALSLMQYLIALAVR